MSEPNPTPAPLPGDSRRQAIHTLGAYAYQIWRSTERWLRLTFDEVLYLECAEDFDIVSNATSTAVQVKASKSRLTLSNRDALSAIVHFWDLTQRVGNAVRFQYLTRAPIGRERGRHFNGDRGIDAWRKSASGDATATISLRHFLRGHLGNHRELIQYLDSANPNDLSRWFARFEWITEEPDIGVIRKFIERRLIRHGDERGVSTSNAVKVIDSLFSHCFETACASTPEARTLTREDFLHIFSQGTSVSVPMSTIPDLLSAQAYPRMRMTAHSNPWLDSLPPLPEPTLPRQDTVDSIVGQLPHSNPIVIAGSAGKGKTTIAKLVALASKRATLWLDLSGRDEPYNEAAMANLAVAIEDHRDSAIVVVDDLPVHPSMPQALWTSLAMLHKACRDSNCPLLITTQGVPRERLDSRLLSTGARVYAVDDLNADEIKRFMIELGCPLEISDVWSPLILAQTSGHPKLVHVHSLDLRDRGWPTADLYKFPETPAAIAGQREAERLNVAQHESGPNLAFLYHLTLVGAPFTRAFCLALGKRIPGLDDPGSTLDRYVGRWIECSVNGRFRITSLLSNEALKAWTSDAQRSAHSNIFESFLEAGSLDVSHVFTMFAHAYNSGNGAHIAAFVHGCTNSNAPFIQISRNLKPLIQLGRASHYAVPFDQFSSLLFRFLQFRVATNESSDDLADIAQSWHWEIQQLATQLGDSDERVRISKMLWASLVATTVEGTLPPGIVIEAILFLDEQPDFWKHVPALASAISDIACQDPVTILFSFFQARCRNVQYLDCLLDCLCNVPDDKRDRMLCAHEVSLAVDHVFIIEGAWAGELEKATPDWAEVLRVLRKAASLAQRWNASRLGHSASKAIAVVLDEHCDDKDGAFAAIDEGANRFGRSALLDDQAAIIYSHMGDDRSAMALWDKSLAFSPNSDTSRVTDPYSFRRAAISSFRMGNFDKAAELLLAGSQWALKSTSKLTSAALQFDAAYALFKADRTDEMCNALRGGLSELFGEPDPEQEFRRFGLQKLAGHVVLWLRKKCLRDIEVIEAEPVVGCCSNPEYDEGIKQLQRTPAPFTVMNVIEIEHNLRLDMRTSAMFGDKLRDSKLPFVEMVLASIDLEQCYRSRRLEDLPDKLAILENAIWRVNALRRTNANFIAPFELTPDSQDCAALGVEYFFVCALADDLLRGGGGFALLSCWNDSSSRNHPRYLPVLSELSTLLQMEAASARDVVSDSRRNRLARITAALTLIRTPPWTPEVSAYAATAFFALLHRTDARGVLRELIPIITERLCSIWQEHLLHPALLRNPRSCVPELSAALQGLATPKKLANIFVAIDAATGVGVPVELVNWLRGTPT